MFTLCATALMAERIELESKWLSQPTVNSTSMPDVNAWTKKARHGNNVHSIWLKAETPLIPAEWNGSRIILDFTRINGNAIIFVNGKKVGERLGPYGEIDITKQIVPGKKNEVLIFNTRDYTDVSRSIETDLIRYYARGPGAPSPLPIQRHRLGIDAPVYIVRRPVPAAISDCWTETSVRNQEIIIPVKLDVTAPLKGYTLAAEIYDADDKKVLSFNEKVPELQAEISNVELKSKWADPILWKLDAGYLYTAKVMLRDNTGKTVDQDTFQFGFREVWVEGRNMMLNGNVMRWRVEWSSFGINEHSISLFKLLGRNMIYFQSNPTAWWRDWAEVPYYNPDVLSLCDENGIAVLLPLPTANYGREAMLNNEKLYSQYMSEVKPFLDRYRRHPSIIAWCMSMNSFNPRDGIHPDTMGQRSKYAHVQAQVLNKVFDDVKKLDPSRLVYGHAEGNLGDIANANCYPNFAPLQEVEDWPAVWAKKGDMPWWAAEYAAVYNGSYYKGKQLLITEYGAINLGEEAYRMEGDELRSQLLRLSIEHTTHGRNIGKTVPLSPLYHTIQRLYVKSSDRAWRTWGISGWHYFNFGLGYGDPPTYKSQNRFNINRYTSMTKPVSGRPEWANDAFDYHSKYMQQLLLYIGGYPTHTDKTHSFFSGEKVSKNIVAVWDGPENLELDCSWTLTNGEDKTVLSGKVPLKLKTGDIKFQPVEFTAPEVSSRQQYKLHLTSSHAGEDLSDVLDIEVFPQVKDLVEVSRQVTLFDPESRSQWVKERVKSVNDYKKGQKFGENDLLIIGSKALNPGGEMPFAKEDFVNGLQVLILEQMPEVWDAMGLKSQDLAARVIFPVGDNPVMKGLKSEDLRYWRGTPDLLPEYKHHRAADVVVAPKSSNRNTIASTILEIPQATGFRPLLCGEFDLNYSPLMTYRAGKGGITYSSLDLSGRVGVDPAATTLADNILSMAGNAAAVACKQVFADKSSSKALTAIGIQAENGDFMNNPERNILVRYGSKGNYPIDKLNKFVEQGGTLINIGIDGYDSNSKIYSVAKPEGEFSNWITYNLLRWRDYLNVDKDKVWQEFSKGRGREINVAVTPEMLLERYPDSVDKQEAVRISVLRLYQLLSRTLTYAQAEPSGEVSERLLRLHRGTSFSNLDTWYVFGPFKAGTNDPTKAFDQVYPGEKQAMAGDLNPNFTYLNKAGKVLDFRNTAVANSDGFLDLAGALQTVDSDAIGFAIRHVHSDTKRRAMLRLGVDYFMRVYVNGKLVYDLTRGHSAPKPNVHRMMINLEEGENSIVLKIMPGSKGFGFWSNMSNPGANLGANETSKKEVIYNDKIRVRNPYEYFYW